jgi:hypothetical protein
MEMALELGVGKELLTYLRELGLVIGVIKAEHGLVMN